MRIKHWNSYKLWYQQPAANWNEALPVGNGRLGAMVFGGVETERLQINEDTLWSGGPHPWNNPHAREVLPLVRQALFAGNYLQADELCKQMQGPYNQSYLPMGDLLLQFEHSGAIQNYTRQLDLDSAIASVGYQAGNACFTRQVFASFPDQLIVVHLSCDQPGLLNCTAQLNSLLHYLIETPEPGHLVLHGQCPSHVEPSYRDIKPDVVYSPDEGMAFEIHLKIMHQGGKTLTENGQLHVVGANRVTLLLSAATSFNGYDRSPRSAGKDPSIQALAHLNSAAGKSFSSLRNAHLQDHRSLFRRVLLDLGVTAAAGQPTDLRLKAFHQQDDPQLAALIFQMGRYLMIASSRPGSQPANLQGIWNDQVRPPWSSNWTTNINTEMNYWPVETCNLAECHQPLLDLIKDLAVTGAETARVNYGCPGWVVHHNVDLWRQSAPPGDYGEGSPQWASWAMAAPWLCQDLWEHYAFGGDRDFLRSTAWPLMKGAAEFYLAWLIADGQGRLVTAPSVSPENAFLLPDGQFGQSSLATTMDMALIWDLFTNCIETMDLLGIEPEFKETLISTRERLSPPQVGKYGQLQEWSVDWDRPEDNHRHISHLFGLHPGRQITRHHLPELRQAVRTSLNMRGDLGTGWSLAWKINCWARLQEGDHAYKLLSNQLTYMDTRGFDYTRGGTYPNLLDAHPPFQIDGNFGTTSGIAEMLLQSHAGEIELLPALPAAWPSGQVQGLRARGGFEVDIAWQNDRLRRATLISHAGGDCRLRPNAPVRVTCEGQPVLTENLSQGVIGFITVCGKSYLISNQAG